MPFRSIWKARGEPKASTPDDYPRIYLFGDSLTERAFIESNRGFGWMLQKYYANRADVVNEGYSGYTTRSVQREFKGSLMGAIKARGAPPPLFITIFFGANDACLVGNGTFVPLVEYEEHIRDYVDTILQDPATQGTKVILISPPPVDVPPFDAEALFDGPEAAIIMRSLAAEDRAHRTWESKRQFAKKIVEIGKEYEAKTDSVALLDFWTVITKFACHKQGQSFDELDLEEKLPGSGMPGTNEFGASFFVDGLHFGETANEVLGRELLDLVLNKWPELKKDNITYRPLD